MTSARLCVLVCMLAIVTPAIRAADDAPPAAPPFKAGFAERDITPELGMEQPGGYGKVFHRVFHDACKVRAAVFDDGTTRVALVGIDALSIGRQSVEAARKMITAKSGIPGGAVLVGASHSHSAGPITGVLPGEYDQSPEWVRKLAYEQTIVVNAKYAERVERAIADAVCEADERRVEARCAAGFGHEDQVAFNRRFRMKSGLSASHPGVGNPDIIEPAGPIDPQVGVIGAWDAKGKFLGCVVNFACHATTGPGGTSADWIYYMEKAIRGATGEDAAGVVFLQGAAGDVTQVDNRQATATPQSGEAAARKVGGRVGAEAVKVLVSLQPSAGALSPIAVEGKTLNVKRRAPSPARLAKCTEIAQKGPPKGLDTTDWTFAKEIVLLAEMLKREPVAKFEIQAIQVGPVVLLANPSEYFCQYGLDLKKGSKFPVTFPVSLANDIIGYVPTEEALGPGGGGYETRLTAYSNLEPTGGTQIRDALLELAGKLKPGVAPVAPPAPPFKGTGWKYGNVPPELE
jgi:neutral ceramidase